MKRGSRRTWPSPRQIIKAVLKAAIIPILDPALLMMQTAWDFCCGKRRKPVTRTRDVLLARVDGLGDFIVGLDATRRLADHYRAEGRRVTLLVKSTWAELADSTGVVDRVLSLDFPRYGFDPWYRARLNRMLRRQGFQIAVYLPVSRELVFGDALIRATRAGERIGSAGYMLNCTSFERAIGDRWYTRLIPAAPEPMHELERNAEFLRGFGIHIFPALGTLPVPPSTRKLPDGGYFVLCPGAGQSGRRWPPESFAALAGQLAARTGWRAVIAGGPSDGAIAAAVQAASSVPLVSMAGAAAISPRDLVGLLAHARLVVTNETGAGQIAACLRTPTVVVMGGMHFGRFLPHPKAVATGPLRVVLEKMPCFDCNGRCTLQHSAGESAPCVARISVAAVWKQVEYLLDHLQGEDVDRLV